AVFKAVLLAVLAGFGAFGGGPPSVIGEMLAHAIVLAGIAQLVVTGVGFLRLRRGTALSGEADTGSPQKVRQLDEPPRRRFGPSPDAPQFFAPPVPGPVAPRRPPLELVPRPNVPPSPHAPVARLLLCQPAL